MKNDICTRERGALLTLIQFVNSTFNQCPYDEAYSASGVQDTELDNPPMCSERLKKVKKLLRSGNRLEARRLAESIREEKGEIPEVCRFLGQIMSLEGEYSDALHYIKKANKNASNALKAGADLLDFFPQLDSPHTAAKPSEATGEERALCYVLGASQIRSISNTSNLFPLFLGPGYITHFLTPEQARLTCRMVTECLKRIGTEHPVLIALGASDVRIHIRNYYKTKEEAAARGLSDREFVVERIQIYCDLLEKIKPKLPKGLYVLGVPPGRLPEADAITPFVNARIAEACQRLDIPFLDLRDCLADPDTGLLEKQFAVSEEDDHIKTEFFVPLLQKFLREQGGLPETADEDIFSWTHLFQMKYLPGVDLRIWPELQISALNSMRSLKVAQTAVAEKACQVVAGLFPALHSKSLLVVNSRDGYIPLSIPWPLVKKITAAEPDQDKLFVSSRVLALARRKDVQLHLMKQTDSLEGIERHDIVMVILDKDTPPAIWEKLLRQSTELVKEHLLVVWTGDRDTPVDVLQKQCIPFQDIEFRNKAEGYWENARIVLASRSRLEFQSKFC